MNKILIVIDSLKSGGAEKILIDIITSMDNKDLQIDLLLINKTGEYISKVPKNIMVFSLINTFNNNPSIWDRVKFKLFFTFPKMIDFFILKSKYNVCISFLEGDSTRIVSKLKKCSKKIAWVHTDVKNHRKLGNEESVYNKFDRIVCVSKNAKKSFVENYKYIKDQVSVIYNPINKEKILKLSEEYNVNFDNSINLVSVGRLVKEKGYVDLIKAHKILLNKGFNIKLHILGTGSYESEIRASIKELQVENSVKLLGFIENPYPYIKASDIFVSSSIYEGFSLVLAEALVLNKNIVATKTLGAIELLEDGIYGELCECSNYIDLENKLENKIKNIEYKNTSFNGTNKFDFNGIIKEIEDLIKI